MAANFIVRGNLKTRCFTNVARQQCCVTLRFSTSASMHASSAPTAYAMGTTFACACDSFAEAEDVPANAPRATHKTPLTRTECPVT